MTGKRHFLRAACRGTKRAAFFAAVIFSLASTAAAAALEPPIPEDAPPWPSGDVTVTLPFSQGNESDAFLEFFAGAFTGETGKKCIPRYISGQGGADAWARMADDAPDGSVLTVAVFPNITLRAFQADSGVFPSAMAVCHVGAYLPCALWAAAPSPFDSVRSVVETARTMQGAFLMAGPGTYSAGQVAAAKFDRLMGVRTTYIPYAGSREAARAVLNRQAAVFWATAMPASSFGKGVRPLAVAAEARVPSLPGVPTFRELGIDLVEGYSFGIAMPRETPAITQKEVTAFFSRCAADARLQARAAEMGFAPTPMEGESAREFVRQEIEKARLVIEDFGLTER